MTLGLERRLWEVSGCRLDSVGSREERKKGLRFWDPSRRGEASAVHATPAVDFQWSHSHYRNVYSVNAVPSCAPSKAVHCC